MNYEQLKKFILEEMRMQENRNYQPVMIRYLNQNRGKATRLEIQRALHNANPELPVKYFKDSPVFDVLTSSHPVADWNRTDDTFKLFDYETFTPHNKAWITTYCDQKIKDSANPINPRIILFSAAGKKSFEHFNETIKKDVISNTLPGDTILKDFDAARVWGSIYNSQNYNKWKELKKGDILLFYHNKKYVASGILEGTEHNQELADYLWGVKDEDTRKTFELMVFMQPSSVFTNDVDFQKVNTLFGYDKDFMPTRIMDFTPVNKEKTDELIEKHGSLENALKAVGFSFSVTENSADNFEQMIQKFNNNRKLFNPERTDEEDRESIRLEFTKKFPQNQTLNMKIEDYAFGTERQDTFCHYIGSKIPDYGNIGRFNAKYCVYWKSSENRYEFLKKYPDYQTAFNTTKNTINNLLLHAQQFEKDRDWNAMDDFFAKSEKNIRTDVKSKILAVYFPKTFLDIHSLENMVQILEYFGVPTEKIENNHILLQEKILEIKDKHPVMRNWSIQDYSHFVWQMIIENKTENAQTNYLLFYHSPPGKKSHADRNVWDDVIGNEYPYGNKSGATSKITPGSKAVWMFTENDEIYFWGYGEIESNEKINDKQSMATMKNFERLGENNKPKKASVSLRDKIKSKERGKWNQSNAIMEINDKIYNEIISKDEMVKEIPEKTFDDEHLPELTKRDLTEGYEKIQSRLLIPKKKILEIVTSLASGSHVILAGPIGTGKTELAKMIPEVFWSSHGGYYSDIYTATADWNTQDVIGGIVPKMKEGNVQYQIQDGCVTESVKKNLYGDIRKSFTFKGHNYRGVWAIIDEFNRADIDKAFGQLFTALRTREMKIPSDSLELSYESITIPKDFRMIGTLNTADKHYLFPLSNALKSRFAFIEIDVPSYDERYKEVYYALKRAIESLGESCSNLIELDDDKMKVKLNIDNPLYSVIYQAYNFLAYVRMYKKLGTAILKIVYQNLLTGYKLKQNLDDVLDNSINSIIIPQLEGLSEVSLNAIMKMSTKEIVSYFKDTNNSNKRLVAGDAFTKTIKFLQVAAPSEDFIQTKLPEDFWKEMQFTFDDKTKVTETSFPKEIPSTIQSLKDLSENSVI